MRRATRFTKSRRAQVTLAAVVGAVVVLYVVITTALQVSTHSSSSTSLAANRNRLHSHIGVPGKAKARGSLFGPTQAEHAPKRRSGLFAVDDTNVDVGVADSTNVKYRRPDELVADQEQSARGIASPYCDPRTYRSLSTMMELAHRSLEVPLDAFAPALLRPLISDSGEFGGFERSIEQLRREQQHEWRFVLEGSTVTVKPQSNLLDVAGPFASLDAGFYCLSVVDDVDHCIVASIPFSVLDSFRKGSEYGVAPMRLGSRTRQYHDVDVAIRRAREEPAKHKVPTLFRHRDVQVMYSRYMPFRSVSPVVLSVPSVLEEFYRAKDFLEASEYRLDSPTVALRHIRIGGDEAVDLEYGKGSMWVVTGEAFARTRASLARRDKQFYDSLAKKRSDPPPRAQFEHYSTRRLSLSSLTPEESARFDEALNAMEDSHVVHRRRRDPSSKRHLMSVATTSTDGADDVQGAVGIADEAMRVDGKAHRQRERHRRQAKKPSGHSEDLQLHNFTARVEALDRDLPFSLVPLNLLFTPRSSAELLNFVEGLPNYEPCLIRVAWSLTFDYSFTIRRECLFVVDDKITITIRSGAVVFAGLGPEAPLLFTSEDVLSTWGGFVVFDGASLTVEHAIVHRCGSGGVPRVPGTGTHIKSFAPAFTVGPGSNAKLVVRHSAVLNAEGTAFALGARSVTVLEDTLVQDVAQGGECVSCIVNITRCHFIDFPFSSNTSIFVDGDNDGFYFRGGVALVEDTVFLNAMDDCVDSASSKGDTDHSRLTFRHVAFEHCQHEGVALSGSKGTTRFVEIRDSLVTASQQGIENGHTPVKHRSTISHTVLYQNHIGLRNGDNYFSLDVFGKVDVNHSLLVDNTLPVLDWVEIDHSGKSERNTFFDRRRFKFETHNPLADSEAQAGGALLPLITLRDCTIQQSGDIQQHSGGGADGSRSLPEAEFYVAVNASLAAWQRSGVVHSDRSATGVAGGSASLKSSAVLEEGIFCGRPHFLVEGTVSVADSFLR